MAGLEQVQFRRIGPADSAVVANIIRVVMPEFGANRPGFAIHDDEVDHMYEVYQQPRSRYIVCEVDGEVVGGAGVASLKGGDPEIAELKKMYFLPAARGSGYGRRLLTLCLGEARNLGFRKCYIETFHTMQNAIRLYESAGFQRINGSLGETGHFACDAFYLLDLENHFSQRNM
jgi:putative acetyltransferase